jgi:hypothetical protein
MLIKVCQNCGAEFQARSNANKNCGQICGNISANRLKAAKYLAKAGIVRSKGARVNDARLQFENHVPHMALSRQLWNDKFKWEGQYE